MGTGAPARVLHVANGTSTTRLIEAAGIAGARSIWADPLHAGPVPRGLSDAELVGVRTSYLSGSIGTTEQDPVNDLWRWRAVIERGDFDELILWFEHDLFDQLNLVQLLDWIGQRPHLQAREVSLICIGSFPMHSRFKGLGELTPAQLASLIGMRQSVGPAQYRLAMNTWSAFREPTPEALDVLRRGDTSALPFLSPALGRLLQELPWIADGLSRTERRLLQLAHPGPIALLDALARMHDGEDVYFVTDASLADHVAALCGTSPALLDRHSAPAGNAGWMHDAVAATPTGRDVLAQTADRIVACGIDRWLGGVHLQGRTHIWRWDDERGRVRQL